jgi:sporulation protein YlmC with PRC-barrel domain
LTPNIVLYNLADTYVFTVSGERVGSINELLLDPHTGIVRSIRLRTETRETIKLPWSGMRFDKSRQTFFLTSIGEIVVDQQNH